MIIAIGKSNRSTGTTNIIAQSFDRKVATVAAHTCVVVRVWSASSEICIPSASDSESAIAIVRMPPITTPREFVPE